jgi:Domain of unknown function (DUF1707)
VDSFDDRQRASGLPWGQSAGQPAGPSGALSSRDSGPGLRVSDSERDLVATELGEHFQEGRLDQSEFDDRLTSALRARTRGDLAALLADLPRPRPRAEPQDPSAAGEPYGGGPGAGRLLPLLIPLLFVVILTAGYTGQGGPHHGAGAAGLFPLLWLWWLIPLVVFRMRRGRGPQGR